MERLTGVIKAKSNLVGNLKSRVNLTGMIIPERTVEIEYATDQDILNLFRVGDDGDGIGKADLESERILLQFVEVHQLVHQFQHPVHTSAYNHQKIPVGTLYVRRFGQLRYRSGNQGERCPEFM